MGCCYAAWGAWGTVEALVTAGAFCPLPKWGRIRAKWGSLWRYHDDIEVITMLLSSLGRCLCLYRAHNVGQISNAIWGICWWTFQGAPFMFQKCRQLLPHALWRATKCRALAAQRVRSSWLVFEFAPSATELLSNFQHIPEVLLYISSLGI